MNLEHMIKPVPQNLRQKGGSLFAHCDAPPCLPPPHLKHQNKNAPTYGWYAFVLVEAGGVEPPSENAFT